MNSMYESNSKISKETVKDKEMYHEEDEVERKVWFGCGNHVRELIHEKQESIDTGGLS